MAAPDIFLEHITLEFSGKPLFQNFSLHLRGGSCTCILGPSGCGKSTLLNVIAGLPCQGAVRFALPEDAPCGGRQGASAVSQVAWMSQNDLLLPWLSLFGNVLLGARLRGELTEERREKARALLEEVGLAEYANVLPAVLSGGMRQRGALVRTLLEERQVLLMDEPFSALDALTRLRLQDMAARMTAGRTVLLVTHDPQEALRLGHDIVILQGNPVRVAHIFQPEGIPPRNPATCDLRRDYAKILRLLMDGPKNENTRSGNITLSSPRT